MGKKYQNKNKMSNPCNKPIACFFQPEAEHRIENNDLKFKREGCILLLNNVDIKGKGRRFVITLPLRVCYKKLKFSGQMICFEVSWSKLRRCRNG